MSEQSNEFEFYVAGVQFHELKNVIGDIELGDILELRSDPDNKFDSNAIEIRYNDVMIGFVPKKGNINVSVLASIEIGLDLKCEVIEVNKDKKPWEQLKVRVSEAEDDLEGLTEEDIGYDDEYDDDEEGDL